MQNQGEMKPCFAPVHNLSNHVFLNENNYFQLRSLMIALEISLYENYADFADLIVLQSTLYNGTPWPSKPTFAPDGLPSKLQSTDQTNQHDHLSTCLDEFIKFSFFISGFPLLGQENQETFFFLC